MRNGYLIATVCGLLLTIGCQSKSPTVPSADRPSSVEPAPLPASRSPKPAALPATRPDGQLPASKDINR